MESAKNTVDQIFASLKAVLPESLADDAKNNIKAVLSSALKDLDVVSRDELEVQNQVLLKTRAQLDELATKVAQLEAARDSKS